MQLSGCEGEKCFCSVLTQLRKGWIKGCGVKVFVLSLSTERNKRQYLHIFFNTYAGRHCLDFYPQKKSRLG